MQTEFSNVKHIICDTNIWYDMNDDIFDRLQKDIKLYTTRLNVLEVLHSNHLFNSFNKSQNAGNAILKYADGFIDLHPFSWEVHTKDIDIYNFKKSNLFKDLNKLSKSTKDKVLNSEEIKADCNEWKECLNTFFVKHFMDSLKEAKYYISKKKSFAKSLIKQKKIKSERANDLKLLVLKEFNNFNHTQYNIDDINWSKYELYLNVRNVWTRQLIFEKTMNVKKNDLIDMLNMIYVRTGWLYWTKDRSWINTIKEAGMGHCLFDLDAD